MPNHTRNEIYFPEMTDEQFAAFVKRHMKEERGVWFLDFETVIPMPKDVYRGPLGGEEMKKYPGDLNWYDWSCRHWGTKWNSYDGEVRLDSHTVTFLTAWSAPFPVMHRLFEKEPFVAEYTYQYEDDGVEHMMVFNKGVDD